MGEHIFSTDFLANRECSPNTPSDPEVIPQLHDMEHMTRRDFRALQSGRVAALESRPGRKAFSSQEDLVIKKYYRPIMTKQAIDAIQAVCGSRTTEAISRRATNLRLQLIAKGDYEISELPHGRYNHQIGIEIEKAKKQMS